MKKGLILLFMMIWSSVAFGEDSKIIDFNAPLLDLHGVQYKDCVKAAADNASCEEFHTITLGDIVLAALEVSGGDPASQKANFQVLMSVYERKPRALTIDAQKRIIDALWALRTARLHKGIIIPLSQIGQAVRMISPADASAPE